MKIYILHGQESQYGGDDPLTHIMGAYQHRHNAEQARVSYETLPYRPVVMRGEKGPFQEYHRLEISEVELYES